ncbi:transglutaminase-like domain-containing protein [Euzebya tangerina]|uniref:transglutaminase-like domain-containing protein n=1 Tax=Euzebya tangerina TaxID=591198 RepID=UPI0013C37989|nr:transglutaminase-like domain-containing protein [Euzebya tangerina]
MPGPLLIHEFLAADVYGVTDLSLAEEELATRTASGLIARIMARRDAPLVDARGPADRVIGNCRQYAVIGVALLRREGIEARVRGGFAAYLGEGWNDHWIVEYRSGPTDQWIRADAMIDPTLRELFGLDFDRLDLPPDAFLTGSEAWTRCRQGEEAPDRFGIGELKGAWFVACNTVRDLVSMTGTEVHVWDTWGVVDNWVDTVLDDEDQLLVDRVAAAVLSEDIEQIRRLTSDPRLAIPQIITSHRSGAQEALW